MIVCQASDTWDAPGFEIFACDFCGEYDVTEQVGDKDACEKCFVKHEDEAQLLSFMEMFISMEEACA